MTFLTRRNFLRISTAAAATATLTRLPSSAWAQPVGANDAIRMGVIGLGDKGTEHVRDLLKTAGVRVVALCDVDPARLAHAEKMLRGRNIPAFTTTDARALLDRPDVDAVLIATCNHWHALLTIWACQAGKDVCVEKPVSHSLAEGPAMIAAAARHGRIVQSGSQLRSDTGIAEAVRVVRSGELGKVQWIHGNCFRYRKSIGRKLPWYPENLDYDRWCGPAAMVPLERDALHYDWHWVWNTGGGDLANIGAHVLDIARRFVDGAPRHILSFGARYGVNDAGETPNTQLAVFDYPGVPVIFESRGLPAKPGVSYSDQLRGIRNGVVVQCEQGYYAGYVGGGLYRNDGQLIRRIPGDGGAAHMPNFLAAIRSRRPADLAAGIEVGHASISVCHLANVSYRVGTPVALNEVRNALREFEPALGALEGMTKHLAQHAIDPDRERLALGPWLPLTGDESHLETTLDASHPAHARVHHLLTGLHRPPYWVKAEN